MCNYWVFDLWILNVEFESMQVQKKQLPEKNKWNRREVLLVKIELEYFRKFIIYHTSRDF